MKCKSLAACKLQSANKLPLFSRDADTHCFVGGASVSGLPLLQRGGGVPILLEVPLDRDAFFRPFHDTSSDDANKTPSSTVDGEAHGSGGDAVREHPVFHRSRWDPMGHDWKGRCLSPAL
jgi:hypothetical protein